MSEKGVVESYAVIREALEKNNRGNVVNSLQNCVLALTHDPLLGGHIRRNLFNERLTIDCPLPWVRESSVISDTDLAFLQLHLERHYGLKAERCLPGTLKIAATDNAFHPRAGPPTHPALGRRSLGAERPAPFPRRGGERLPRALPAHLHAGGGEADVPAGVQV